MNEIVVVPCDDYVDGVSEFQLSLGYTYLSNRFTPKQMARLVLVLTLSGVDPWSWEKLVMWLVFGHKPDDVLLAAIRRGKTKPQALRAAVELLQQCAEAKGVRVGAPPTRPIYLASYGVMREGYITAYRAVYGEQPDEIFSEPWPIEESPALARAVRPAHFETAFAMMGMTARAIEHLMKVGGARGDRHDDKE